MNICDEKVVAREYEKRKSLRKDDVQALMKWVQCQPHLPKITEIEAIVFLHSCKYSVEYAKQVTDIFYTCRTHSPEFFSERSPEALDKTKALDMMLCTILPKRTEDDCDILFVKILDYNLFNFATVVKIASMIGDLHYLRKGTSSGLYAVYDMEGSQLSHLMKTSPLTIKKAVYFLQEAMPIIRKGSYFINAVPWMDKLINLLKMFVKSELMSLIHWLGPENLNKIEESFPIKLLPKDLGGEGPSIKELHDEMKKDLLESENLFQMDKQKMVNELLRPGKPKNASDLFGIEGSFRKLDID